MPKTAKSTATVPGRVDSTSSASGGADPFATLSALAGGKTVKKGRESKPEIHDPELAEPIETFIKAKLAFDDAETLLKAAKDQVSAAVAPARLAICVRDGKVHPSVSVNGKLTYVQTRAYSNVPQERVPALEEAFGEECDTYFKPLYSVALTEEAANNLDVVSEMLAKLGNEFVAKHLVVRHDRLVTERFHQNYTTQADVQARAQPFFDDQTIKPYSASLKIQ